jgi:hypothetical protein
MNVFNRVLGLVLGVLLAVAGVVALVSLFGAVRPEQVHLGWWIEGGMAGLADLPTPGRWWALLASLVAVIGGLGLAMAEVSMGRPAPGFLLRDAPDGQLTMSLEAMRGVADHAAAGVEGVLASSSHLRTRGSELHLKCRVLLDRAAIVPVAAGLVQEAVQGALAHQVGVPGARVTVHAELAGPAGIRRVQ